MIYKKRKTKGENVLEINRKMLVMHSNREKKK